LAAHKNKQGCRKKDGAFAMADFFPYAEKAPSSNDEMPCTSESSN